MRLALLATLAWTAFAQLSLPEAVRLAGEKYPSVQASLADVKTAAAGVQLARTAYLPRADFLAQLNRATRNNVTGMLLPQPVIPSISGPAVTVNAGTNVWGSATGFLVTWEPFDFGLRGARVDAARASQVRAEAAVAVSRLEAEAAAGDAYLTVLAAGEALAGANAGRDRAAAFLRVVAALAASGLRPGADEARARAELALAESQTIQAAQAVRAARATLVQLTGADASTVLAAPPAPPSSLAAAAGEHPSVREQTAATEEIASRLKVLDKSWAPRFSAQSALYARGTGAFPDGTTGGPASGLGPSYYNWGVGFTVFFPILEIQSIKAEREAETSRKVASQSRLDLIQRELAAQRERAAAQLEAAERIARLAPIQLEAARSAEQQAQARYQSGLAAITEVAEAQRLLVQAEVDQRLAGLNVWRGWLAVALARGDLQPFVEAAGK